MANKTKKGPGQRPAPEPKKLPIVPILGGVVAVALVVAIAIGLASSEEDAANKLEFGTPAVSGSLEPFDPNAEDTAIGSSIPSVVGTNFDGEAVELGPNMGAGAVVFLAHWCPHCQDEVPDIQAWIDSGAVPAAPLYSVATGIDSAANNYPPWSWLEREGWTTPIIVDDEGGTVMRAFGGSAFPYWVFFGDDGNVVGRVSGRLGVETVAGLLELAAAS